MGRGWRTRAAEVLKIVLLACVENDVPPLDTVCDCLCGQLTKSYACVFYIELLLDENKDGAMAPFVT
jgi:hypothetical protein